MKKYVQVAINTIEYIKINGREPNKVWQEQADIIFGENTTSAKKGCPKGAFLWLCEEGLIKGISSGKYTKSIKNKEYAIRAINILRENHNLKSNPIMLWEMITLNNKAHNYQMDIVCELFKSGYIIE